MGLEGCERHRDEGVVGHPKSEDNVLLDEMKKLRLHDDGQQTGTEGSTSVKNGDRSLDVQVVDNSNKKNAMMRDCYNESHSGGPSEALLEINGNVKADPLKTADDDQRTNVEGNSTSATDGSDQTVDNSNKENMYNHRQCGVASSKAMGNVRSNPRQTSSGRNPFAGCTVEITFANMSIKGSQNRLGRPLDKKRMPVRPTQPPLRDLESDDEDYDSRYHRSSSESDGDSDDEKVTRGPQLSNNLSKARNNPYSQPPSPWSSSSDQSNPPSLRSESSQSPTPELSPHAHVGISIPSFFPRVHGGNSMPGSSPRAHGGNLLSGTSPRPHEGPLVPIIQTQINNGGSYCVNAVNELPSSSLSSSPTAGNMRKTQMLMAGGKIMTSEGPRKPVAEQRPRSHSGGVLGMSPEIMIGFLNKSLNEFPSVELAADGRPRSHSGGSVDDALSTSPIQNVRSFFGIRNGADCSPLSTVGYGSPQTDYSELSPSMPDSPVREVQELDATAGLEEGGIDRLGPEVISDVARMMSEYGLSSHDTFDGPVYQAADMLNGPVYEAADMWNGPVCGAADMLNGPVCGATDMLNGPVFGATDMLNGPVFGAKNMLNGPVYKATDILNGPVYGATDMLNASGISTSAVPQSSTTGERICQPSVASLGLTPATPSDHVILQGNIPARQVPPPILLVVNVPPPLSVRPKVQVPVTVLQMQAHHPGITSCPPPSTRRPQGPPASCPPAATGMPTRERIPSHSSPKNVAKDKNAEIQRIVSEKQLIAPRPVSGVISSGRQLSQPPTFGCFAVPTISTYPSAEPTRRASPGTSAGPALPVADSRISPPIYDERFLDVSFADADGDTNLHIAVANDDFGLMCAIIERIGNRRDLINVRNKRGQTPLFMAVFNNNVRFTQYLLDHGAEPNPKFRDGSTPMHLLARKGPMFLEVGRLLCQVHDVPLNSRDPQGFTALHIAVQNHGPSQNMIPFIKMLLNCGADLTFTATRNNETALHLAVELGLLDVVMAICYCQGIASAINIASCKGTALHYAAMLTKVSESIQLEIVRTLLLCGSSLNERCKCLQNKSAKDLVARDRTKVIKLLKDFPTQTRH